MSCEKMLMVNEIFTSIDGEGVRAGELATFVRLAGCNLRCSYCDTAYALGIGDGEMMSIEEVKHTCAKMGIRNVTLTGGEPLMQCGAVPLVAALSEYGFQVNIETNGSIDLSQLMQVLLFTDGFVTMDIKCPSSGMDHRNLYDNLSLLRPNDVVKFVVGSVEDMDFMMQYADMFRCKWYISPVFGKIDPVDIVKYMMDHKLERARVQLQLHKIIWDPDKRGV